jgi:glycosyltransferase involved in cell wall biosynthesis
MPQGRVCRVAFLTPQFPTEKTGGGVGTYVQKMAALLNDAGHDVEVFVLSRTRGTIKSDGITVHRVPRPNGLIVRLLRRTVRKVAGSGADSICSNLFGAWALSRALEARHQAAPADVVQSANFGLVGFFVAARPGRRRVVRLSTSRVLWEQANGTLGWYDRVTEWLDVACLRRADHVYAPSEYLARYFRDRYDLDVAVVRPAVALTSVTSQDRPAAAPLRYLLHFSALSDRKGVDLVAAALERAIRVDPSIEMVWAGPETRPGYVEALLARHGIRNHVRWVGLLEPEDMQAAIQHCEAAILPSRADNLPNTALEALSMQRPVIAFADASMDEFVHHGASGFLLPPGDVDGLAAAMVSTWVDVTRLLPDGFHIPPGTMADLSPRVALDEFLDTVCDVPSGTTRAQ